MMNKLKKPSVSTAIKKTGTVLPLFTWLVDQFQRNWPTYTTLVVWSLGVTGLGFITEITREYAPLSYAVIFAVASLLFLAAWVLISWSSSLSANARLKDSLLHINRQTNPLENHFEGEIISLQDFVMPDHMSYQDKTFSNCKIYGPHAVYLHGSATLKNCTGQISSLKLDRSQEGIDATNIISFKDTSFNGCEFHRVTFIGTPDFVDKFFA